MASSRSCLVLPLLLLALCFLSSDVLARKVVSYKHGGGPSGNWFTMKMIEVTDEPHQVSTLKSRLVEHLSRPDILSLPETFRKQEGESLAISPMDGVSQSFICKTCLNISMTLQEALSDPETLDRIMQYANSSLCGAIMPGLEEECAELVATYVPEVVNTLQQYTAPNTLCLDTHICLGPEALLLDDDRSCAMCEEFATEALQYMGENKTLAQILSSLHSMCSKLKGFQSKCNMMVDLYVPVFFAEATTLSPQDLCQKIKLCTPVSLKSQSRCDTCQQMILQLAQKLKDPTTQLKLIMTLMDECNKITDHVNQCKALVFHYGPLILANVDKYLDADMLCSKIHACDSNRAQHLVMATDEDKDTTLHSLIRLPSLAHGHAIF